MTYAEFATARGITVTSARRMAVRYRWRKTRGNDGFTRLSIPLSAIPEEPPPLTVEEEREEEENSKVLIAWLIESTRLAEKRAERAEAQIATIRAEYIRELRELREWQMQLLDKMQPRWRLTLRRSSRPTAPPIGQLLGSIIP